MIDNLKNAFSMQVRLNRSGFLFSYVALAVLSFCFFYLNKWLLTEYGIDGRTYLINKSIFGIILLVVWTPFVVKRLHDIGVSGWWVLVLYAANPFELRNILLVQMLSGLEIDAFSVPMMVLEALLLLFLLGLFFVPGKKGENKWGGPDNRLQSDVAKPHA